MSLFHQHIQMEMRQFEFYVTLPDGKGFKVVQQGRTASEAKMAVESMYPNAKSVMFTKTF